MTAKVDLQFNEEDMLVEVIVQNGRKKMVVAYSNDVNKMTEVAKFLISAFSDVNLEAMKISHKRVLEAIMGRKIHANDISK